jgi:WD40 repeat protein
MLIQTPDGRSRVYDRANAPERIWEILRIFGGGSSWVPEYKPQSIIEAREVELGGFLCATPDERQILFTWTSGPLQLWDSTTHKLLAEVGKGRTYGEELVFSPDAKFAAMAGWGDCTVLDTQGWSELHHFAGPVIAGKKQSLYSPQFLHNGHYLLLHNDKSSPWIIDVGTWQRLDRLSEVPNDAVQFFPSPSGTQAIVRSNNGSILLSDLNGKRAVAKLASDKWIYKCAFAPDESLVATVTTRSLVEGHSRGGLEVETWDTKSGERAHYLRPFERSSIDAVEGLIWSPDGKYIFVATNPSGGTTAIGINVFNAKSGRHCGEFVGYPSDVNGISLLPASGQLVAGCIDGKIRIWDLKSDLKQIAAFEGLLAQQHASR